MSDKTSLEKNLNIVKRYYYHGRRKCNSNVDIDSGEPDPKQSKTCDNKVLSSAVTEEQVKSNVKQIKTVSRSKAEHSTAKKKKEHKNDKTSTVEINNEQVDIENCAEDLMKTESARSEDDKVKWYPVNWEEMLKNIREMRKDASAPVDSMGCHKTMDEAAKPEVKRYQALVSLMLSSQTKDQITYAAMLRLREHGLTVENILKTEEDELAQLIKTVGFWRIKAKHIKRTTQILKDEYNGDIPDSLEKMLKLPGVGPKMANLCMTTAWGKVQGIGVDTHVHRISNRLKWVKKPTKTPEQTRVELESWLPPALWFEVNHLMVGLGQQICLPRNPKCGECINNKICPFGKQEVKRSQK